MRKVEGLRMLRTPRVGLCAAGGKRFFDLYRGTATEVNTRTACPECGRDVNLRQTKWGVAMIPPHKPAAQEVK